jgi:hypothetical protein
VICARTSSDTPGRPRSARDTVDAETPAARATSVMLAVTAQLPLGFTSV